MVLVVGGHSRNIGKTSVAAAIVRATPEAAWTAVKISRHPHGVSAAEGFSILQETSMEGGADTSRYLAAGARRAFWLRAAPGRLAAAIADVGGILGSSTNALIESNSILEFLTPDLYLVVIDPSVGDSKESSRRYFDRAGALVWIDRGPAPADETRPVFVVRPQVWSTPELVAFLRARLALTPPPRTSA